jgi:hypothetical protein
MPDDRRVLEGIERMVVDGTNVLHAIRRSPTPLPAAALIGRLRAILPGTVSITVVLDGSPEHGLVARQVASGVEVRYSGRGTADEMITHILDDGYHQQGPMTLVVTDDIELSVAVRRYGGRTARTGWLIDRLERQRLSAPAPGRPGMGAPTAPSIGSGSGKGIGPGAGPQGASTGDADEAPRWSPGRGATRKVGNARRRPNSAR